MYKHVNFSDHQKSKDIILKRWNEFRQALLEGQFTYDEVAKAKEYTFLQVYDDLFNENSGIEYKTKTIEMLIHEKVRLGRGAILTKEESLNYDRFVPSKEFIKEDNRFSPAGVEWLYLAVGDTSADIQKHAKSECRVKCDDRFGFCYFSLKVEYKECKLVDLTIANNTNFDELNRNLVIGLSDSSSHNKRDLILEWAVNTYSLLLSEQIFRPLENSDNKSNMYAPFQTMAKYYISLGYSGIIFGSTVNKSGKNMVLFDKNMANPTGEILDELSFC